MVKNDALLKFCILNILIIILLVYIIGDGVAVSLLLHTANTKSVILSLLSEIRNLNCDIFTLRIQCAFLISDSTMFSLEKTYFFNTFL